MSCTFGGKGPQRLGSTGGPCCPFCHGDAGAGGVPGEFPVVGWVLDSLFFFFWKGGGMGGGGGVSEVGVRKRGHFSFLF